ncbi:glycosyl hydrolases family 31-domain-containing protein [Suillus subluteus]|nr:glycosyl hydrolases family 31-domain-containing protein [Suillus subluteus]
MRLQKSLCIVNAFLLLTLGAFITTFDTPGGAPFSSSPWPYLCTHTDIPLAPSLAQDFRSSLSSDAVLWIIDGGKAKAVYGPKKDMELVVDFNPLKITLFRGGMTKAPNPSLDITFLNYAHVYGILRHTTHQPLSTAQLCSCMRILQRRQSPFSMRLHRKHGSISAMWRKVVEAHWISESGILDVFLLPGRTPTDVFTQYAHLTGTAPLPAYWSLGYHQCRWNYVGSDDMDSVQNRFDEEDFPVDVFWLDIEYAEDHKYFMWNKKTFPGPVEMTKYVEAVEQKMVVINWESSLNPRAARVNTKDVADPAPAHGLTFSWDFWISLFKTKTIDVGAFLPFLHAHAHINTKHREPYHL